MEKNKYDIAIEYLTNNPHNIFHAWSLSVNHSSSVIHAHCLFERIGDVMNVEDCGCLTEIREDTQKFACIDWEIDYDLTERIRADERIPTHPWLIGIETLPVFKEWQERIDKIREDRLNQNNTI